MKTYEFVFADGTRFSGEGASPAEALHNAYLRNGYLPYALIVGQTVVGDLELGVDPAPDVRAKGKQTKGLKVNGLHAS